MKNIEITPQQALGLAIITAVCLNEQDIITDDLVAFIEDKADEIESVFDSFYYGETISHETTELWVKELVLKGIEACKNLPCKRCKNLSLSSN